jgi:hypothetical protein
LPTFAPTASPTSMPSAVPRMSYQWSTQVGESSLVNDLVVFNDTTVACGGFATAVCLLYTNREGQLTDSYSLAWGTITKLVLFEDSFLLAG